MRHWDRPGVSLYTLRRSRDFFTEQADLILARKALLVLSKSLSNTNYISEKYRSCAEDGDKTRRKGVLWELNLSPNEGYRFHTCIHKAAVGASDRVIAT